MHDLKPGGPDLGPCPNNGHVNITTFEKIPFLCSMQIQDAAYLWALFKKYF